MLALRLAGLGLVGFGAYLLIQNAAQAATTDDGSDTTNSGEILDMFKQASATGNDTEVLARTIYGEARGEGYDGMVAVANVVMNRCARSGRSPAAECQRPLQFSCWNASDPNRALILAVTTADPVFNQAVQIAAAAVAGALPDTTGGALNYYNPSLASPSWAASMTVTAQIGNHVFGIA